MSNPTDHVSPEMRSSIMRAVKSAGGRSTERRLRAMLIARGIKGWRVQANQLPGKPDFIFPEQKFALFVDGCFWHGCPKCYRRPHSNQDYWDNKVVYNIDRDRRNRARLRRLGWRVLRFWEHEITLDVARIVDRIGRALNKERLRNMAAASSSS